MELLAGAVLEEFRTGFKATKRQADSAISQVVDEDLFRSLDPGSNSIAVIMRHCAGNMRSRWRGFLTSDGEKPDRQRDQEFEPPPVETRAALREEWDAGWALALEALDAMAPDDLAREVAINGERMSALVALGRASRHYAGHAGQIVLLAKHFCGSRWETLSVPRGKSDEFFRRARG